MKITCLLILHLAFIFHFVNCQTWAPIGAKWYYDHYTGMGPNLTIVESIADTSIQSQPCKTLQTIRITEVWDSTGSSHWDSSYCALQYTYEDSGRVYFFDCSGNHFNLLYDFNATVSDTVTVNDSIFNMCCALGQQVNLFQYKIDSTNDTIIDGILLHRQFVSPTPNADWLISSPLAHENYPIIERIGSTKFLWGGENGIVMEGPVRHLRCYMDNEFTYHAADWADTSNCGFLPLLNAIEKEKPDPSISVFPNPAKNQIKLATGYEKRMEYLILNTNAGLVKSGILESGQTRVELDGFSNGLYLLMLKTDNKVLSGKFLVEK